MFPVLPMYDLRSKVYPSLETHSKTLEIHAAAVLDEL